MMIGTKSAVRLLLAFALLSAGVAPLFAGGKPEDSGQAVHVDKNGRAAGGADVVAYFSLDPGDDAVIGSEQYSYEWRGAAWLFASQENLEKFRRNPEKYAPAYGGYCAWAMAKSDLAPIDPDMWAIEDGTLYLNYNRRTQNDWLSDRAELIENADAEWPVVREKILSPE